MGVFIMSWSRTKLKLADWPLCSKSNTDQNLEQNTRKKPHSKLTILPTRSSGKCKIPKPIIPKTQSSEIHVCDTCKEEIPDISRVLLMRDKDGGPRLLCFHYFFPCWDMELLVQRYPNLKIDKVTFSVPENILMKQSSIEDLQRNHNLWI
jgi:hypothetical protein